MPVDENRAKIRKFKKNTKKGPTERDRSDEGKGSGIKTCVTEDGLFHVGGDGEKEKMHLFSSALDHQQFLCFLLVSLSIHLLPIAAKCFLCSQLSD